MSGAKKTASPLKAKPVTPARCALLPTPCWPSTTSSRPRKKDYSKLAWLALPAALIIGGVTWYLMQGGKLDEAAYAGAQGVGAAQDTATAPRGMAAETGSSTVARGLIALAVVAMAGAAAFVARRKFFA